MKVLIIVGLILFIVSCCVLAKRYDEQIKKEMEEKKYGFMGKKSR
jgi:hypothetical protein